MSKPLRIAAVALVAGGGVIAFLVFFNAPRPTGGGIPPRLFEAGRLTVSWETPAGIEFDTAAHSNIRRVDYSGPESCRKCHPRNHANWSQHPHRWMNAVANEKSVKGDFSGQASIEFWGGHAEFYQANGQNRMRLEKDRVERVYAISRTIGSRFFQYYVGRQVVGPEPEQHMFFQVDHVLPFGYWLDRNEWIPVVHLGPEMTDDQRFDPYLAPPEIRPYFADYSQHCNVCHTTFPLGDLMSSRAGQIGRYAPHEMQFFLSEYLKDARPDIWDGSRDPWMLSDESLSNLTRAVREDAPANAVTLGVSCEACHLGSKAHAEGKLKKPQFFPSSPYLQKTSDSKIDAGRTRENVNWACGRCHTGKRPQFAAGMTTWNSVEFDDAMRGGCYSRLTCVDCHDPHTGIGPQWKPTPAEDDAKCLKCHERFKDRVARQQHTHHAAGSSGDRCMNCHMPRLNEGLQDVVRTHMIFSPTNREMLTAGHPNACNICHTDESASWTLRHLRDWYNVDLKDIPEDAGNVPAAVAWLRSGNPAVRLVATDALA